MDYNNNINIKSLLEKYWEGETSLNEETTLFDYFNSEEVATELKVYQPMFQYFKSEKSSRIENEDFETRLLAELEASTIVPMRSRRRGIVRTLGRIAAVALLLLTAYIGYQQLSPTGTNGVTEEYLAFEDLSKEEQQAYETTKSALLFVSAKLNKGTRIATDNFNKVKEKTQEAVRENKE